MEAVARECFNSEVTMVVLNQSQEDERTGKKEHVVFLVKQTIVARKTRDQDHSNHRGVGVCGCMLLICFYMHILYVFSDSCLTCALCDFPQEALFGIMRDRCASLAGKRSGWDLLRAVVLTEKGELHRNLNFKL